MNFNDEYKHIGFLLKQAAHLSLLNYNKRLEQAGLTVSQDSVLSLLFLNGTLTQTELLTKLLIKPSSLTKLVDTLEKKQLVRRVKVGGDARIKYIELTEKGQQLEPTLWMIKENTEQFISKSLTSDEAKLLAGLLEKVRNDLDQ